MARDKAQLYDAVYEADIDIAAGEQADGLFVRGLDLNADYVLFGAPGDAVQRITDLLRDRDEETVRVVERTVEALLRALDEQQTT